MQITEYAPAYKKSRERTPLKRRPLPADYFCAGYYPAIRSLKIVVLVVFVIVFVIVIVERFKIGGRIIIKIIRQTFFR